MAQSKKILMIVGDFVEDYEVMVPFQALVMVGYTVHAVCPNKKKDDKIATAVHDFEGDQTYSEKRGHNFTINYNYADVKAQDYIGLVIPGGRAPEYLRLDKSVIALVQSFANDKKPIAAICHGLQLLTAAGCIKGKSCSGYYACGPEVTQSGAVYQEIGVDKAITDGNIVTAPAWPAHPEFLSQFIKLLGAKITL